MHLTTMRPTFEMELPMERGEALRLIRQALERDELNQTTLLFNHYIELHIPTSQVRFWSPHLGLSFEEAGERTRVYGRFAPRNEVWTLIWVIYLLLAFSAFFAIMFELSSWSLGRSTWFGIAAIILLIGIGIVYTVSQIGQMWSSDQMLALKSNWQHVLDQVQLSPSRSPHQKND